MKFKNKYIHIYIVYIFNRYRGVAHASCNLNYKVSHTIPVVFHNLSGYDAHLFIRELAQEISGDVSVIPNNAELYTSFTKTVWNSIHGVHMKEKIKLRFIDSARFLPDSLSNLASILPTEKKNILHTVCGRDYSMEQISMLERKGVYPYSYMDCVEKLKETSLPPREQFYNHLNDERITSDEYKFACQVWDKFNLKTMGEYSELYLKTDVLLLADIFENFRETCYKIYKLDVAHHYTSPGFSFDAMLKYTGVKIELITDVDMLLMIERGVRGGISQCSKRRVKANNKYMKDDYNPNEKSSYLMYLDGLYYTHFTSSYMYIL